MSGHTPGPWVRRYGGQRINAKGGVGVAKVLINQPEDEFDGNSHLIAAAPELLEACQTVLAGIERGLPIDANTVNGLVVARLRAAIDKAEGRACS